MAQPATPDHGRGDEAVTPSTVSNEPKRTIMLRKPYLVFLADADSSTLAKTAFGLRDWCPNDVVGQMRLAGAAIDLGVPEMNAAEARAAGIGSLVIGVASFGGALPETWYPSLFAAVEAGLDIVSGMHQRLSDVPGLAVHAAHHGVTLHDIRHPGTRFAVGTGRKRSGQRLLTVGTDCALGKKYTALAITKSLKARGIAADFRGTGQTGIMIAGSGIPIDAVVSDFVAGAAEALSPDAAADHWDVIEGQGALFHPAYAAVTLGLLHGSQPDALVLCHDPARRHIEGYPDFPIVDLAVAMARYREAAWLTNPAARFVGISLNTAKFPADTAFAIMGDYADRYGLPVFDPIRTGADILADTMLATATEAMS
ncbi:MAG: EBNA-1 nuclear protein [Sphingomonas sp. 28-63-12]|nr:MAG: EBNA-1 nuclear protein [Sphingomonas sp. 28-63-12]